MFGTGKFTGTSEPVAAPPLPHEIDLVAPPVLTQPMLPHDFPKRCDTSRIYAVAAVAMLGVSFAAIASVTFAVHRQFASTVDATVVEAITEPIAAATPQPAMEDAEVFASVDETPLVPVVMIQAEPQIVIATGDDAVQPSQPQTDSLVVMRELTPHDAEESGCPAEEIPRPELLLALAENQPDLGLDEGGEDEWEEVGGSGRIDFMCAFGGNVSPAPSPTCDSGTCPAPKRFGDPRSYGTKIVFADNMKEARDLAAEQNKLLFVMHVSGNFAIEGFT